MRLLILLVVITTATPQSLTRCTNHANGYCIQMLGESCPSGTYVSYSGCGFLEQCCYVPDSYHVTTQHPSGTPSSQCGVADYNPGDKIVGGTQTVIEKYPWQVSIRYFGSHSCGGSIINDRWILTAAHCINEVPQPAYISQFSIVAGSTNQLRYPSSNNYYTVEQILTHQGYTKTTNNDIALIKVNKPFDLNGRQMRPICLADEGDDFTGQVCVATGWGSIAEGDEYDSEILLREVDLAVVSHSLCTYYMGRVDSRNICAGPRIGGKDTCQGDSGGPLVCMSSQGVWKQAGIVSYGNGCANANNFGIYTEVSKYRDWITDVLSRY